MKNQKWLFNKDTPWGKCDYYKDEFKGIEGIDIFKDNGNNTIYCLKCSDGGFKVTLCNHPKKDDVNFFGGGIL